jgi:hypothetical protein
MELCNNDILTIYLHASMEAMWMDLKMEIAFGVDIQLKNSLRCKAMRPQGVYTSKVACETARR